MAHRTGGAAAVAGVRGSEKKCRTLKRLAGARPAPGGIGGMPERRLESRGRWVSFLLGILIGAGSSPARAQAPGPAVDSQPAPPATREAEFEERLRKLEAMNQRILQQHEAMERRHNERYEKLSREFRILQDQMKSDAAQNGGDVGSNGIGASSSNGTAAPSGAQARDAGGVPGDEQPEGPEGTRC
jgi:hypothetical protein